MTSEVERRAKSPLEFEFAGHAMITGTNCVTKGRALDTCMAFSGQRQIKCFGLRDNGSVTKSWVNLEGQHSFAFWVEWYASFVVLLDAKGSRSRFWPYPNILWWEFCFVSGIPGLENIWGLFFPSLTNSASTEEKSETFDPKCHEKKTSVPQDGHYAVPLAHLLSSLVDNICCDMRKENVSKLQEKTPRAEKIHLHGYEADCIVFFWALIRFALVYIWRGHTTYTTTRFYFRGKTLESWEHFERTKCFEF